MERYTYFDGGKWRMRIGDTEYSGEAVNSFAAYEELGPIDRLRELAQADRLLDKDIYLAKERISGTVTELAINSDGISLYVRSGGGGFYIGIADALDGMMDKEAEHGTD